MGGIKVMVFLVHCTADLLICDTVPVERMRYASMETCKAEVARLLSRKRELAGTTVWMGKCVYRLSSPDPRRARRDENFNGSRFLKTVGIAR